MSTKTANILRLLVIICLGITALLSALENSKNLTELKGLFWLPLIIGMICALILLAAGRWKK